MGKTSTTVIEQELRESYDEVYYNHVYSLMRYMLGDKYRRHGGSWASVGELPDYPDILPRFYLAGESRRILTHSSLMMFKVCYMEPKPDFPDLDKWSEIVNRGFIQALWRKHEWAHEAHSTFLSSDGYGVGFTQVGVEDGEVSIKHHSLLNTIWDRHVLNVGQSRFIGFIHHFPVEEAAEKFGNAIKKDATQFGDGNNSEYPLRRVKVLEVFDRGIGRNAEPTSTLFLNNIGGRVLGHDLSDYTDCLPFAYCEHVHHEGMRRPMGRVDMQIASQMMRNGLERYMKMTLERGSGIDVIDMSQVEAEDAERLRDGELLPLIRLQKRGDAGIAVNRLPAQDIPRGVLEVMTVNDREQNAESGNSDADRANMTQSNRTLGEVQRIQAGADVQTNWSRKQYAQYLRRLAEVVIKIGAKFHVKPIKIDMGMTDAVFNDPADPRSALAEWLAPGERVTVNEDELQYQDPNQIAQLKLNMWMPFLQDPFTNPMEIRKKVWEIMGEKDPESLFMMPTQPQESAPV